MPQSKKTDKTERLKRKLLREVKAREQAEKLLEQKSEELFAIAERTQTLAQAIESAADGIALTDSNGIFTYMNASHALMFGYKIDELIGQPWSILYPSDELERFDTDIMPEFERRGRWQGDTQGIHKDGDPVHQSVTLTGLENGGLICATRDVTSKKRRELIAREMETRLHEAERVAAITTIGRTVAHDLNNLLAAISGYAILLETDLQHQELGLERAKRIERAAQQAIDVVQSLEEKTTDHSASIEKINLSKLIKTTVQIVEGIRPSKIRFNVKIQEGVWVHTDKILLSRCLLNILKNSIEAIPERGTIYISMVAKPKVKTKDLSEHIIGFPIENCQARIEIRDTGLGIPKTLMEKIFDPFFSTKSHETNQGLGLQSLRALADKELAYIELSSEENRYTKFTLFIQEPSYALSKHLQNNVVEERKEQKENKSILLVEDDELVGDMLKVTLSRMGHKVVWETNPLNALETIKENIFDLVITDYNMPNMNGDVFSYEVKLNKPEIPIILYSGQASIIKPNLNYSAILRKPILPQELKLAILAAFAPKL